MMLRIGIFFGGVSREREISFAGGKTAYQHLDRSLFTPTLIFVDSLGNFIVVEPAILSKENIRSFYPPIEQYKFATYIESFQVDKQQVEEWIAAVGKKIQPEEFKDYFDFALIALHGQQGEDGTLQGLLEWYNMPYSSCGVLSSAVGIDKGLHTAWLNDVTQTHKRYTMITWDKWKNTDKTLLYEEVIAAVGFPFVCKAPHQGSSIGVAVINQPKDVVAFIEGVEKCFFVHKIVKQAWLVFSQEEQIAYLQQIVDLDKGIGFPVYLGEQLFHHPETLLTYLPTYFDRHETAELYAFHSENRVLFEEFIAGQEFSCGVIQDENGKAIALPPTEIISAASFDFEAKYKVGGSQKVIPIRASNEDILAIQEAVVKVFEAFDCNACARIDGFLTPDHRVILHDPNTIPGMSPTSLIFKQTAEIGLNVTQTITYLIRASLFERIKVGRNTTHWRNLLANLDHAIATQVAAIVEKPPIDLVLDTTKTATNEDLLEVRKAYSQLTAKGRHEVRVILVAEQNGVSKHFCLPFALLLKDTIAEVLGKVQTTKHPMLLHNIEVAQSITAKYAGTPLLEVQEIIPHQN
jgi:D-alanine-D-alanine ligase